MKKLKLLALLACISLLGLSSQAMAIVIVPTNDPNIMVGTILGPGVVIVPGSATYTGATNVNASGTFTGGVSSGIGIESGVILTSGQATDAAGPNNSDNTTVNTNAAGDAQLNAIVAPNTTNDASVLEFDFFTSTGNVSFNYVFASEEYNEFANTSFNDVFAFFLDGVNIALIPGTSTPVSINTVNGGNPFGTNAQNPQFYNNNDLSNGGPFFDIEYDGFTDVFAAVASGLDTSVSHHIKLAIADTSDSSLDSAVFIQAASFVTQPPTLPIPSTLLLLGPGLLGLSWVRRKSS